MFISINIFFLMKIVEIKNSQCIVGCDELLYSCVMLVCCDVPLIVRQLYKTACLSCLKIASRLSAKPLSEL